MTKFIAVVSGKGGVGRTTTTINLGIALKKLGIDTTIIDTDITSPNLALILGAPNTPNNLEDALQGKKHILETIYKHQSGVKIIPSSLSVEKTVGLDKLSDVLPDLVGNTEVVLIDCPSGLGVEAQQAINASDEVLIITNLDLVSVTDALRTIIKSEDLGKSVIGVVVNKFKQHHEEISLNNLQSLLKRQVLGVIPNHESLINSQRKHPSIHVDPSSEITNEFLRVASKIIGKTELTNLMN